MKAERLFPYQERGALWLKERKFCLLADEMGLGKSAQAIRACDYLGATRVLVFCPAVARSNWMNEWRKFSSRNLSLWQITTAQDAKSLLANVTICSYDLTANSKVTSALSARSWDVLVLDESHYLKSRKAKRTKAVLGKIAPRAARVWCLSGTPAPNDPSELWPWLRVSGAYDQDYWRFVDRYCLTRETPFGMKIIGGKNISELKALLAPHMLRRRKEEVMTELPSIVFSDVVLDPDKIPLKDFDIDALRDEEKLLRSAVELDAIESAAVKCKSVRQFVGLQKVKPVAEMLRSELESNAYEKVVVFGVHRAVLEGIRSELRDFGAVLLYGGTDPKKRDEMIHAFQNDPKTRVFVGNVQAAGTAITLTAAHNVVFAEADWVPANNAQAAMRVHRIGQTRPVSVRFVGVAGSIDEHVQRSLARKARTLTRLFDQPVDERETRC